MRIGFIYTGSSLWVNICLNARQFLDSWRRFGLTSDQLKASLAILLALLLKCYMSRHHKIKKLWFIIIFMNLTFRMYDYGGDYFGMLLLLKSFQVVHYQACEDLWKRRKCNELIDLPFSIITFLSNLYHCVCKLLCSIEGIPFSLSPKCIWSFWQRFEGASHTANLSEFTKCKVFHFQSWIANFKRQFRTEWQISFGWHIQALLNVSIPSSEIKGWSLCHCSSWSSALELLENNFGYLSLCLPKAI